MSADKDYLESRGWRLMRKQRNCHQANLWDHPDHQHSRRGCFTQVQAVAHQKRLDRGDVCHCIPKEETTTHGT